MSSVKTIVTAAVLVGSGWACVASAEIITLRSGQVGGVPGVAGQSDDIITVLSNNPPGGAISASAFTASDFAGAVSGPSAKVINAHPAWTPGISDPLARWVNFAADLTVQADGTVSGTGYGLPGSALYAIPFIVTTPGATTGIITIELSVDDALGDQSFGGGNPDGMYSNGAGVGFTLGNYATPTVGSTSIPLNTGLNYLYLYQRDLGVLVSGLIFSAKIEIVPAPGIAGVAMAGLVAAGRRRRR